MKSFYKANQIEDVMWLADTLDGLPPDIKLDLLLWVTEKGYMIPNIVQRTIEYFIHKWRGNAGVENYRRILWSSHPETYKAAWDDFIRHLEFGTDRIDPDSVGGYSQSELDSIHEFLIWRIEHGLAPRS